MTWGAVALAVVQFAIALVAFLQAKQKLSADELKGLADALSKQADDMRRVSDARANPDRVLPVDPFDEDGGAGNKPGA